MSVPEDIISDLELDDFVNIKSKIKSNIPYEKKDPDLIVDEEDFDLVILTWMILNLMWILQVLDLT